MRDAQETRLAGTVLVTVDRCIQICSARAEACTRAARDVSDRSLKALLDAFAEERDLEAAALRSVVEPLSGGSPSGVRMRHWHEPRIRRDRIVLEDCIQGELASLVEFEVTFSWAPLSAMPMDVRALMLSAYGATLRTLSELRRHALER